MENQTKIKHFNINVTSVLTVWFSGLVSNSLWPKWLLIGGGDFTEETVSILAIDGTIFGLPLSSAKFCSIYKTILTIRYMIHSESDIRAMWNSDHNFSFTDN